MSYLVLARKFRPRTWPEVVGQSHVTNTLQNAIRHQRIAHAYLFTGPRGIGKTSIARIFAKALNCLSPVDGNPCGECGSCREITGGGSIDVFEIDGASNRGIEDIRNLRENIKYTPTGGKYRIYIIDEVHMLTTQAFNALLKTLEEPPAHALFVFATTEPHKVPATILSRCQRFDFKRISSGAITARLKKITESENIDADEAALGLIARKADGSLRDSQSILDQMISYSGDKITVKDVIAGLGLIEPAFFFKVTGTVLEKNLPAGMEIVGQIVAGGYDTGEFLSGLVDHLRNCLIVKSGGSADYLDVTEDDKKIFAETAERFQEGDLLRLIKIANDARLDVKRYLDPRLPLELALIRMIRMDQTVAIDSLISALKKAAGTDTSAPAENPPVSTGTRTSSQQTAVPAAAPAAGEKRTHLTEPPPAPAEPRPEPVTAAAGANTSTQAVQIDKVKRKWIEVVSQVKHRKITIGSFLNEGVILGVKGDCIEIGFSLQNGFHIDAVMKSKQLVEEVLADVFGCQMTFVCRKKDIPSRDFVTTSKKEKQAQLKDMQQNDPVVKKIIDDFDAEIVD